MSPMLGSLRWWVPLGLVLLWAASLPLPALEPAGGPALTGFDALTRGWRAADVGVYSWYANPAFLLAAAAAALGALRTAAVLAGVGLLLALTSFAAVPLARSGGLTAAPPLGFGPGFYLWLAAQAGLALWCPAAPRLAAYRATAQKFPVPVENRD